MLQVHIVYTVWLQLRGQEEVYIKRTDWYQACVDGVANVWGKYTIPLTV